MFSWHGRLARGVAYSRHIEPYPARNNPSGAKSCAHQQRRSLRSCTRSAYGASARVEYDTLTGWKPVPPGSTITSHGMGLVRGDVRRADHRIVLKFARAAGAVADARRRGRVRVRHGPV